MSDTKYGTEDVEALLAELSQLRERVTELEAADNEAAVEARIAEAREEAEAKVAELQGELDDKVLELSTVQSELTELKDWLDAEAAAAAEKAEKAERASARKAIAEELGFPAEFIESRLDGWAAMDQAAFDQLVEGWREIATREGDTSGAIPKTPGLGEGADREKAAKSGGGTGENASRQLLRDVVGSRVDVGRLAQGGRG
jgi:DNA repair exonuclease SbcCD ATPase subunit